MSFYVYTCGDLILDGFTDCKGGFKSPFAGVFILFVLSYSTRAYFYDVFHYMYFLLVIDLYPLDTLT